MPEAWAWVRVEAGGAGGGGREASGDRARDERGALLLQPLDQRPLLRHQRVDFRRLAVEEVGDGALVLGWWECTGSCDFGGIDCG